MGSMRFVPPASARVRRFGCSALNGAGGHAGNHHFAQHHVQNGRGDDADGDGGERGSPLALAVLPHKAQQARLNGFQEAGGSNPLTQTIESPCKPLICKGFLYLRLFAYHSS